jgi:hypothetical protein
MQKVCLPYFSNDESSESHLFKKKNLKLTLTLNILRTKSYTFFLASIITFVNLIFFTKKCLLSTKYTLHLYKYIMST